MKSFDITMNKAADPATTAHELYDKYGSDPRNLRILYYRWISFQFASTGVLPSYELISAPFSHFQKVNPLVKHTLLLGATAEDPDPDRRKAIDDDGRSVSIHIIQDWKIFSHLKKEQFIGQHIDIGGITYYVADVGVVDFPCSSDQLEEHVNSKRCRQKIIFAYAYMFYYSQFCHWLTKHVAEHPETLVGIYFSDSHHMVEFGCSLAFVADYLISSHPDNYQLLSSINPYVYVDKIYLNQWNPITALEKCRNTRFANRDFSLYGTFNQYPKFPRRNKFITTLSTEYGQTIKLNTAEETQSWHAQTGDQALETWLRYGITLVVPTIYDFTTRVCDALSAGHAVLVPKGCTWLDSCLDVDTQTKLGIYRYLDFSSTSLREAYNKALKHETGGDCQERSETRSRFCLEHLSQDCLFKSFLRITRLVLH